MVKKLKLFFAKLMVFGIDSPPTKLPTWLNLLISFVFIGTWPIILGYMAGHTLWGLALAILAFLFILNLINRSYLKGAEYALQNPPKIGKVWVDFKVDNDVIWKGAEFEFSPEKTGNTSVSMESIRATIPSSGNKGGRHVGSLKGGENINNPDVLRWHREAKRILEEDGYNEFVQFCRKAGENESTVRSRIKSYKDTLT